MYIVLGSMYETLSISTGLYPNLDLWNANKLHYITSHHAYNLYAVQIDFVISWKHMNLNEDFENARTEVLPVVCLRLELSGMLHCVIGHVLASYCLEKLMTSHPLSHCKFSEELYLKQWCCENLKSCIV